jgi:hypothetical protein
VRRLVDESTIRNLQVAWRSWSRGLGRARGPGWSGFSPDVRLLFCRPRVREQAASAQRSRTGSGSLIRSGGGRCRRLVVFTVSRKRGLRRRRAAGLWGPTVRIRAARPHPPPTITIALWMTDPIEGHTREGRGAGFATSGSRASTALRTATGALGRLRLNRAMAASAFGLPRAARSLSAALLARPRPWHDRGVRPGIR